MGLPHPKRRQEFFCQAPLPFYIASMQRYSPFYQTASWFGNKHGHLRSTEVISGNLFPLKMLKDTVNLLLSKGQGARIPYVISTSFPKNEIDIKKLIVDFRSLPWTPRGDKQDFTFVEQYRLTPVLLAKRWTDQPLDFIVVICGSYFSNVCCCQTSIFSSQEHVSSLIMQGFCNFEKINISGISWDITIQDGITN